MAEAIVTVEGVSREYGERVKTRALERVDLELFRGQFVALVGQSGSGKSTLLNIIGLLDRPTAGRVVLAGTDTSTLNERALTALRARTLGFVFQFHHLLPGFTALENVMLPGWADEGRPTRAMRESAERILREVGLAERTLYKANDLSGGQQQRVAIARALVRRPALVLADEPTGNLDSVSSNEVFELMRRFNREYATTFLLVTHDSRIASRCDRIVEIADGRVISDRSAS
ncbi:MAG TPA: ABC transporter ATP-binding protein [Polyangiales bacterium]|nr:ABC transporter ATP-binding protein [Polyangiales bacterium]